jgi:hypothetical protein
MKLYLKHYLVKYHGDITINSKVIREEFLKYSPGNSRKIKLPKLIPDIVVNKRV